MTDPRLFGRALTAIAVIGFSALAGIVVLAVMGKASPDVLQNVAVGSLTALAGMLSRPPGDSDAPVPVEVIEPAKSRKAAKKR